MTSHSRSDTRAPIRIRPYGRADAPATLALFLAAVTQTAAADYTPEQISAWAAADERDVERWDAAMTARRSVVATIDGDTAGFSDVSPDGYIDMMFTAPAFLRRGVATCLLTHVEAAARACAAAELTTHASITARPFFERHGFTVEAEQRPVRRGIALTNFRMRKPLE
ncbi:GNAT family N-acetyltransferase [Herbiconiux sp. CPCC 203407]|uniref:GNAT family N-acetyltransferase n=1 Tax=Herbiconiux oxytropis TaxID=2970915 RepID=A0AA42BWB9_9MICO|nr:GNAT family N-acetyltransferase [Herbiconiux oxytropis]MCS5723292.1 GNAT family N-acetyltransferase [Herbiconiux oxytropis]MCS5727834.1 GNAT family N-acetyltransferase [Herbiconiux oxytropis]